MKIWKSCQLLISEKEMKRRDCQDYQWRIVQLCLLLIAISAFLLPISADNIDNRGQFQIGGNTGVALAAALKSQSQSALTRNIYAHFSGNGTFRVNKDVKPGTYRTRTGAYYCYYARLSGFSGSLNDIIINDITNGPAIVTIGAKDKGFQTIGCSTWTKDLSAITKNKTTFGDGNYIVGTDIKPGTYHTRVASSACYYARLSGFDGTVNDIIANNITDATAIVTISARDKGFKSENCGVWTKL